MRMPWQQNVIAEVKFALRALRAPPSAHMPLEEYEAKLAGGASAAGWTESLPEVIRPAEGDSAMVVYSFESYTPWTGITPEMDHGVESNTTLTFPPLIINYHYATVHRIWDYIMQAMVGAHFDASIPYLGSHDVINRFAVTMRDLQVHMPAASSAAFTVPAEAVACIRARTVTTERLQPADEGYSPGLGGMLVTLHDVAVEIADKATAATTHSGSAPAPSFTAAPTPADGTARDGNPFTSPFASLPRRGSRTGEQCVRICFGQPRQLDPSQYSSLSQVVLLCSLACVDCPEPPTPPH